MSNRQVTPSSNRYGGMLRTQTICVVILTVLSVSVALYFLQSVLLPFVIALFVVIGCQPIMGYLEDRLNLHWTLSFAVTFVIGFILLAGFVLLTWFSLKDLAQHADAYQARLDRITAWVEQFTVPTPSSAEDSTDNSSTQTPPDTRSELDPANDSVTTPTDDGIAVDPSRTADPVLLTIPDENLKESESPALATSLTDLLSFSNAYAQQFILKLASSLTVLFSYAILVMIFVFFLLLGRAAPQRKQPAILRAVEEQIRKYIVLKSAISLLTGFVTAMVLWLFGVPLAIVFGFLAFLLNFIPNIGPLICCALPVPFLILNSEMSAIAAVTVFILVCGIQFLSGNVFEPRVMGKSFDLSPIVLLLALMFFGLIWGIIGMFLATPMVSILKIVLNQHEASRPLADLMAGRWDRFAEHDIAA